jgi:hypothetical protein
MYPVYPSVNPWPQQVELRLAGLENRLLMLAAENAEQASRLLALAAENAEQENRLHALVTENAELRATLAAQPPPQPAHITYKIQELHVNELQGTLNIGLTAQAGQEELNQLVAPFVQSKASPLENISFFQQGDGVRQEEQGTPT